MSHTIYYAIVPAGIHIILAASKAEEYGDKYLCKMSNPSCDPPVEYHILVDSSNIYENKAAAERKVFHDKLKGEPEEKPEPPTNEKVWM